MKITIGQPAPDFTLYDTDRNKVKLSDLKDQNVVLLFFPQAFSGVCTKELCSVRDSMAVYNNTNAMVIGNSVDSVFTLKKFREDQHFTFTLLSDFNKEVSALYDSLYAEWILDMKGVSRRSAFVIDKEGIVRYAQVMEDVGKVPDFAAISNTLASLN